MTEKYPDPTQYHRPQFDTWMVHPLDKDYLPPEERWCRVCAKDASHPIHTTLDDARIDAAGRPRPDYGPRIDHPERYTDGPI